MLKERLGSIDAATLAAADLDPVFRERPAIHRFPGAMAQRVHALALHIRDEYDGDAARVWTDAADSEALRANLAGLPGFGEMKVKALGSVLAKRYGVVAADGPDPLAPHARRRGLAPGPGRLPGGQAGAQGRVEHGPRRQRVVAQKRRGGSTPLPLRGALLGERAHALAEVLGGEAGVAERQQLALHLRRERRLPRRARRG